MTAVRKLKRADRLFAAVIFFSVILLYLPAVNFDADIFDDSFYTGPLCTPELNQVNFVDYVSKPVLDLHSPLVQVSFAADRLLWGYGYFFNGLHLSNILYHAVAAVLLYFLCRKLAVRLPEKTGIGHMVSPRFHLSPIWAAAAAAIWAWHPQRVESVAWISERKDVLLSILFFATLLTFIGAFRRGKPAVAAFIFFLLSFAVKPMLITLPAVLWVWMKIETGRFFSRRNIYALVPWGAVTFLAAGYHLLGEKSVMQGLGMGDPMFRATIAAWSTGNYFFSALLPVNLMPFHPFYTPGEDTLAAATVLALLLIVLGISTLRKDPAGEILFAVLLLFPITLLPVCGIIRVGNCDWADRYNLLPSVFLLLPAVFILNRICISRKYLAIYAFLAVTIYTGFLCVQTVLYLSMWRSYKTVLLASTDGVRRPNYRISFLVAVSAFCEDDIQKVCTTAAAITPELGSTPFDRKLINVFHRGMTGLLESRGKDPDAGGKRLTELVLSPDVDLLCFVSNGFLDLVTDAAALWNIRRNDVTTTLRLYETCAKLSQLPLKREKMTAQAALLKNDIGTAEKAIKILVEKNHPAAKHLKEQLSLRKQQNNVKKP